MNPAELKEGHYYRISKYGDRRFCIVYCYRNPDCNNELGIGFNVADGGAWLPLWDISEDSVIVEVALSVKEN